MKWFRMYSEAVDDEKLRLLAFEDRWHFVAILCCKSSGILDGEDADLRRRKLAVKLGLDLRELGEVARRLAEVGLINEETFQPLAWNDRQYESDGAAERMRAYRERLKQKVQRNGDVTVTPQDTDTDTDTEKKKTKRSAAPSAPVGVSVSLWQDWLAVRRAKKQPLTATALEAVKREAEKAKLTLADAIRISVENGWAGFKHSWLQEQAAKAAKAGVATSDGKPWHQTASGIRAKGEEFGLKPEQFRLDRDREDWQAFRRAVLERAGVPA